MTEFVQPGLLARRGWLRAAGRLLALGGLMAGVGMEAVPRIAHAQPAQPEHAVTEVNIDNFTFAPATVRVKTGTTVTWTNRDDIPHVVLMQGLKLRSKVMDTSETFSHRFEKVGSFDYFCALHPHMKGKVVVAN